MTLYERLEQLCAREGIELSNLGQAVGIKLDKSTVSHWKHGAVPRRGTLKAIADHFGVSVEYLTDGTAADGVAGGGLSEPEQALLRLFRQLDVVKRARLLTVAAELAENSRESL